MNKHINKRNFVKGLEGISREYWLSKPSVNKFMCGVAEIHEEDIAHTKSLIRTHIVKDGSLFKRSLDVGAGIGRITFDCLYNISEEIDLVDINENFLKVAKEKSPHHSQGDKIRKLYPVPLQNFCYEFQYDLINIQWVLEYLEDKNLSSFLRRTKKHLKTNGIVLIKENINITDNNTIIIKEEGSMIRPPIHLEQMFESSNLSIVHKEVYQFKSVEDLYEVGTWILKEKI